MNTSAKDILRWTGSAITIAGIAFIALKLRDYSLQLDFSNFTISTWTVVAGFVLIYALANIMLALAWWNLLKYFGVTVHRLWAIKVYGLTQLAKYVPGNIMHLASRQTIGMADGVLGWPLAKASIWELGLLSITGAFFSILVLPQFLPVVTTPISVVVFLSALLIMKIGLQRYGATSITRAFVYYLVFLTLSGLIFTGLTVLLVGTDLLTTSQVLLFCAAFIVAWLIGLITPGSPAGLGVRELVLYTILRSIVSEADLFTAILLGRLVTIGGDLVFYIFSLIYRTNKHNLSFMNNNMRGHL